MMIKIQDICNAILSYSDNERIDLNPRPQKKDIQNIYYMEDISELPPWSPEKPLAALKSSPLTIKSLKVKLDKIYMINSYNEREYLPDVIDAYSWIKLVAELPSCEDMFENEKTQKFFIQEFVFTAIKYMELCRTFKLLDMMIYTQQMMVEALRLFGRFFEHLEKYPRMTLILKHTFDIEKQFFKINYTNQYHSLVVLPSKQEIEAINSFVSALKPGDRVDILRSEHQSKRVCWLPGVFVKSSTLYITVRCDNDKSNINIDANNLQVRPFESKKSEYQWRFNLKVGDKVDYLRDSSSWVRTEVEEVRENQELSEKMGKYLEVRVKEDKDYWMSISDPKLQKQGSITRVRPDKRQEQQFFFEDYNDYILDPEMKQRFVTRSEVSKSLMIVDLLSFLHNELHLFEKIATVVREKTMKIQVVADLINFVLLVSPLFHRQFAVEYLTDFTESILEYINNGKEGTIRNFSKERYEAVMTSIQEFMKRLYTLSERKTIVEKLQLDLILRFLFSDFLDRKLQAVSLLTSFFKMCRHNITKKSLKSFVEWIRENKILQAIYNDKSHSELISKSSDFLKYYLELNPNVEELQPLLIWNQAIVKLVADNFDDLPAEIQNTIVERIKSKPNVVNSDALTIIKKTPNCEAWLLQNGGECWVEVVREKSKRKPEIIQVFKQPFPVVNKITKQMNEMYESNFKNTYFTYMFQINYLCTVLENDQISLSDKLEFITLATELIKKISDQVFELLLKFLINSSENQAVAEKYQKFFVSVMPKLHTSHLEQLFTQKFSKREQFENLTETEFTIFEKCFVGINDNIEEEKISETFTNGKKVVTKHYVLNADIQELVGIEKLEEIIFYSKDTENSRRAIKFIGQLLASVRSEEMRQSADVYINKLLKLGQDLLYSSGQSEDKINLQGKYLKIIEELLNQTETKGVDQTPSVHSLFPPQKIELRLIDNFNSNRSKIYLAVPSNMTLFQFRSEICKHINAYVPETRLLVNGKELSSRYNGHVIHVLDLSGDIVIGRVHETQRVNLVDQEGRLVEKAKIIFKNIFKEYSSFGLMSKKQCLKYHQKCVGEVQMQGEAKVDKIFDQHDRDRDGYLTETDFLNFYEISSRTKQSSVWSNLEAFGVRNDLEILDSLPIEYPEADHLARNKLYNNEKFMKILFDLLASPDTQLASSAWNLAARLPLYDKFDLQLDLTKEYLTRYWLYSIESKKQFNKITTEILSKILSMSLQTVCIGLKVALECDSIDIAIFNIITENLKKANSQEHMDFFNKVVLDYSLKIFSKFVIKEEAIGNYYITNEETLNKIFRDGIMSVNVASRQAFCHTLSELIEMSVEKDFKLFESLFNLVYRIFDKCELTTLTMQYFELFSHLLMILKVHSELMPKLGLNWGLLTQEIIDIYKSHECTETSMTSKPDQVAQGLLKIIAKLLNTETISHIVNLVPFIFQQSLFPEKGRNKLKTSKSRLDAYDLIYEICKFETEDGKLSGGLQKLFQAGFKDIYKKMSVKKTNQIFSYYYSYNEARSELGYAGIRNLGCICYMISMLQQLYMTVPFRNLTLMADDGQPECLVKRGTKEIDDNLFHQLKNMFGYLLLTEKQEYNPDELCFAFKDFEGQPVNTSVQQDAQEFINIFFDKLETSLKNTPFKNIFENIFGGKTCSQTACSGCGAIKYRSQNFYPLSLEIKGWKNIQQSFNKYITGEVISDYQCDTCKNKCDVTKRSFLEKTPNFFIIHLQRMCFNYDRLENEKVNSRWEFPQDLNVYNYTLAKEKGLPEVDGEFTYKLRGIVVHYGTADFGHYFSYIKESDTQWLEFNDERVREFDPSDIEIECFGGEHWRRESQSAYLLVYERINKSDIVLEFPNEADKKKILEQFKLMPAIIEESQEAKNPSESQVSKVDSVAEQMNEDKQEESTKQKDPSQSQRTQQNQEAKQEDKKILVRLDMNKIGQYVPKSIKDKIDQENDEFSFTMNLSNNEFAVFIHNILSINPPEGLREEYLELCYECLNLKQTIKISPSKVISVSEWASERFTELIEGHGWEFMKTFGQNWQSDLLNIQKSTRSVIKCLLHCAINDIIKTNNFNSEFEQTNAQHTEEQQEQRSKKRNIVINFLDKFSEMMLNQVVKHWTRFAQYFELWISLVKESQFVRRYCEEKMLVQKILDFVMEQGYPYPRAKKRHQMGNQYYSAEFEYPLALLHSLLQHGYQLNEMEQKCFKTYAFMDKIICHRVEGANIIETLCKNNSVISQKMGFLLLTNCSNVQQSDQVKPIIASIYEYLKIEDELKDKRVEWIVGFPTYVEHAREKGFGSYGCVPSSESAVNYISALGASPILQQIMKFKKKTQHVTVLLMAMVLQLESDGYINNLDEYPGKMALERTYTAQFQSFIDKYYEESQRPYTSKNYTEYGLKVKRLWQERPNRPMKSPFPRILLGKTIEEVLVKEQTVQEIYEIRQFNIKTYYLPLDTEATQGLTGKNIVTVKNNQNFVCTNLPKPTHYSFMRVNSSDEEETEEAPKEAIFEGAKEGWLLRKIQITNRSSEDMLSVFGVADKNECNLHVPISPLSVQIESNSKSQLILMKTDLEKDYGQLNITFNILGKATNSGYMPRQIITEVDQKVQYSKVNNSDDEEEECSSEAFN